MAEVEGSLRMVNRLPWARMGAVLAAVTLGYSQILFSLILENKAYFPAGAAFHVWVILWTQALPFLIAFAFDTLAARKDRTLRLWRTALYALAAFSFARQIQVHHAGLFYGLFPSWAALPLCALASAGLGLLSARRPRETDRFFAVLGLLALLLTGLYARGTLLPAPKPPAAREASPLPGRPVLVMMFDELGLDILLKEGKIDAEAFPRIAALAEEGAWFPDATSNAAYTDESVPTMLSGRFRPTGGEPLIFERLRESHRCVAQVHNPSMVDKVQRLKGPADRVNCRTDAQALRLGPLETLTFLRTALRQSPLVKSGFASPDEEVLPPPDLWDLWETRDVLTVEVEMFQRLLAEEAGKGRFILWQCTQPHYPFQYDRHGRRHGKRDAYFVPGKYDIPAVWENYREQARGVDRLVGLVVDQLKSMGIYDETLIIVTSDHGPRTAGAGEPEGYPDVQSGVSVRIPFIVRGPSIAPGRRDTEYQNMDFVPTLLDLLGIEADPGAFDGRSAFAASAAPREKAFRREGREWVLDRAAGVWRRR